MNNQIVQQGQDPNSLWLQWCELLGEVFPGIESSFVLPKEVIRKIFEFGVAVPRHEFLRYLMPSFPPRAADKIIMSIDRSCKRTPGKIYNLAILVARGEGSNPFPIKPWKCPHTLKGATSSFDLDTNFGTIRVNLNKMYYAKNEYYYSSTCTMDCWDGIVIPMHLQGTRAQEGIFSYSVLRDIYQDTYVPRNVSVVVCGVTIERRIRRATTQRKLFTAFNALRRSYYKQCPYVKPQQTARSRMNFEEAILTLLRGLTGHGDALHFFNYPKNPAAAETPDSA